MHELLVTAIANKGLAFTRVLFDSWYATKDLMLLVESLNKRYYCPLKSNRQVETVTRSVRINASMGCSEISLSASMARRSRSRGFPKITR